MIKHKYIPSAITPGRCGASELVSGTQGHFICCGKPELAETHNQAKCGTCQHHFTPIGEPLCPRCESYVPEAFEVLMKRASPKIAETDLIAISEREVIAKGLIWLAEWRKMKNTKTFYDAEAEVLGALTVLESRKALPDEAKLLQAMRETEHLDVPMLKGKGE